VTAVGHVIVREHIHHIHADPAEVFALLCPTREDDWVEGWAERRTLVRTSTGFAEPGCVFLTSEPDRSERIWLATRHEPDEGIVEYVQVWPGEEVVTLAIAVTVEDGGSRVRIRHTVVPLPGADEVALADRWSPRSRDSVMSWWERSMNHYLATGNLLRQGTGTSPVPSTPGRRGRAGRPTPSANESSAPSGRLEGWRFPIGWRRTHASATATVVRPFPVLPPPSPPG
jgi:hypothetical protein